MHRRPSSGGFTLLELLPALVVAALTLGVLFALYFTVSRTVQGQQSRRQAAAGFLAADRLVRDLVNAQRLPGYEEGGFTLEAGEGMTSGLILRFPSAQRVDVIPDADRDGRWYAWSEVSWGLDRGSLWRASRALVGPESLEPAVTNRLVEGVESFSVWVRVDDEWHDAWTTDASDEVWPVAARMRIVVQSNQQSERVVDVETVIPGGYRFVNERE